MTNSMAFCFVFFIIITASQWYKLLVWFLKWSALRQVGCFSSSFHPFSFSSAVTLSFPPATQGDCSTHENWLTNPAFQAPADPLWKPPSSLTPAIVVSRWWICYQRLAVCGIQILPHGFYRGRHSGSSPRSLFSTIPLFSCAIFAISNFQKNAVF